MYGAADLTPEPASAPAGRVRFSYGRHALAAGAVCCAAAVGVALSSGARSSSSSGSLSAVPSSSSAVVASLAAEYMDDARDETTEAAWGNTGGIGKGTTGGTDDLVEQNVTGGEGKEILGDGSGKWPMEKEIDLWQFASVKKFMAGFNISEASPIAIIREYLPQLKVRYNPRYAAGALGEQATTGYVVMCLDGLIKHRTASWMVVMTLAGEVVAVRPMPSYGALGKLPVQANALKMRDPHRVLIGGNLQDDYGSGPVMLYDWLKNEFEVICNGSLGITGGSYSSHDLQWVSASTYDTYVREHVAEGTADPDVGGGRDRVWRPATTLNVLYAVDALSGETERIVGPLDYSRTSDMNHFQVLEGGVAIINGRSTGSFRKVALKTGSTLWTCGGAYGNFTLVDIDGTTYAAGVDACAGVDDACEGPDGDGSAFKSLWFGQVTRARCFFVPPVRCSTVPPPPTGPPV